MPSSYPNLLTVGKAAMIEAIRRVKILAQDSTPVRLTLGGDTVQLTAITQDVGNAVEEIDAGYDGAEMTVAFNRITSQRVSMRSMPTTSRSPRWTR